MAEVAGRARSDRSAYSASFIRFVQVPIHREAYEAAYLAYSPGDAAGELARLHHEFLWKPARYHDCACYGAHCLECGRYQLSIQSMGSEIVLGRSSPVEAPMPMTLLLDLAMAMKVLGRRGGTPERIARYLSDGC